MSAPTAGDMKKFVRLGRYLVGKPRAVALYPWQAARAVQDVFTDANWAGCKASRKSTSGGAMLLGSHVVRTWSKTQNTIAQSSAESELLAIVKAATLRSVWRLSFLTALWFVLENQVVVVAKMAPLLTPCKDTSQPLI